MRALIVYESMYGNTRDIALAIADGIGSDVHTDVVEVGQAPSEPGSDVDLLIVGAPTHLFGLSRRRTRPVDPSGNGYPDAGTACLREWLDGLSPSTNQRDALTFETRLRVMGVTGSAAKGGAKRLRKRGYRILWPSQSYYLTRPTGPLVDREHERARLWGRWIGEGLAVKQSRLEDPGGELIVSDY